MKEFANIESRNRHKQKFFYSWEKGDSKTSTTLTTNKWYLKTIFVSAGNFNLAVSSSCQSGCLLHKIETIILFPVTCDFICFFFFHAHLYGFKTETTSKNMQKKNDHQYNFILLSTVYKSFGTFQNKVNT